MSELRKKLSIEARSLTLDQRKEILCAIPETELHGYLARMFREMATDYWVAVTHGVGELGKDLVIVRNDPLSPDVIGVIVKRGDIRGKTSGDVDGLVKNADGALKAKGTRITDEILSQIRQAHVHDAELRTHLNDLKINKIIVFVVGEMSHNARARIEKELLALGQVYDIAWLVDTFTEYYPAVFFDGRAVDFLDSLTTQLEKDVFYEKSGKTLSECFVEPIIAPMDQDFALDRDGRSVKVRNKRYRLSQFVELLTKHKKILLLGEPGSGKSKTLAKITIDRYKRIFTQLSRVDVHSVPYGMPIMLSAKRLLSTEGSAELMDQFVPSLVRERFKLDLLLIDGLDEVSAGQRLTVLNKAGMYADELGCSVVVTSRKVAALEGPVDGFDRYELLPFEFSQAMKLVQKVLSNIEILPALKHGLESIRSQIPMNPLSLLLLVQLVVERKEVPSSITELFDRFHDLVFGRWDQEKGIEVLFEYLVKKRFLASLAYNEFRLKERLEIPRQDFDRFVGEYASKYRWDEAKLMVFTKEIERSSVLEISDEVFFKHRAFLDYFIALFIFEQRETFEDLDNLISQHYFDQMWTEVAFFYVGLAREMSESLLSTIFAFKLENTNLNPVKLLVGRLLQAGWHSTTAVKEIGVRKALNHLVPTSDFIRGIETGLPPIVCDVVTFLLSELSLGSAFLSQENALVAAELEANRSSDVTSLLQEIALLWASRHYVDEDQHHKNVAGFLKYVEGAGLSGRDEAKLLLLGLVAEPANKSIAKSVNRRLRRLIKRDQSLLDGILPASHKVSKEFAKS